MLKIHEGASGFVTGADSFSASLREQERKMKEECAARQKAKKAALKYCPGWPVRLDRTSTEREILPELVILEPGDGEKSRKWAFTRRAKGEGVYDPYLPARSKEHRHVTGKVLVPWDNKLKVGDLVVGYWDQIAPHKVRGAVEIVDEVVLVAVRKAMIFGPVNLPVGDEELSLFS